MSDTSNMLTSQFEVYVGQYKSSTQQILQTTSYTFRDFSVLDTALAALKSVFQEADAALAKYGTEKTPISTSDEMQLTMLGERLKASIESVNSLFPTMQAADLTYIQSAKVATLDQVKLKGLEEKLKVEDAAFAKNLTSMIPPGPGDSPKIPGQDEKFPDTDGDQIQNIPEADEIDLIEGWAPLPT
ncbi:hypothetical protein [Magnetovibrio sp.]|uniref:hypothetical protein n=1 Tax=Magnetovibrio sp. TaxID=2024836 RepID=UPI002F95CA8A